MSSLVEQSGIRAMSAESVGLVRKIEDALLQLEQPAIGTEHLIHGGMYARTIVATAGTVMTGAMIQVPTILVISGDVSVLIDGGAIDLVGFHVLPGSAGRKQAIYAREDTHVTMIFATGAETVAEAEEEFTIEADRLASRRESAINHIVITEE
jgi:hypothetical protein